MTDGKEPRLLNVGYGNMVTRSRVVAVVSSQSSASRRLRAEAEQRNLLVDATQGRRTRSILVMDTGHVVMSAVNPETVSARIESGEEEIA
ncbi:MAG TPA: extracellular matrix/biofilm biosynthesis regulator RemA family protein [Myxococcota bacterium]